MQWYSCHLENIYYIYERDTSLIWPTDNTWCTQIFENSFQQSWKTSVISSPYVENLYSIDRCLIILFWSNIFKTPIPLTYRWFLLLVLPNDDIIIIWIWVVSQTEKNTFLKWFISFYKLEQIQDCQCNSILTYLLMCFYEWEREGTVRASILEFGYLAAYFSHFYICHSLVHEYPHEDMWMSPPYAMR